MVFSDTTTKLGLLQDCEIRLFGDSGYGKITGNSDKLLQFTARINRRQDRFIQLVLEADGRFQYDDINHRNLAGNPDYPEAVLDIESGRRDYYFNTEMLVIEKVLAYPSATVTDYEVLDPIDIRDSSARTYIENATTNVGTPCRYDKRNNGVYLDPVPNYDAPNGLKVVFKRAAKYFLSTNTDTAPGFASPFHNYLSAGASLDYAIDRIMTKQVNALTPIVQQMEAEIKKYYSQRNADEEDVITAETINSI